MPNLLCCFAPDALEKLRSARPWPILPSLRVAVLNRIVVNVVDACPEVPVRLDLAVKAIVPDLASPLIIRSIPVERRSSVEFADLSSQRFLSGQS